MGGWLECIKLSLLVRWHTSASENWPLSVTGSETHESLLSTLHVHLGLPYDEKL